MGIEIQFKHLNDKICQHFAIKFSGINYCIHHIYLGETCLTYESV